MYIYIIYIIYIYMYIYIYISAEGAKKVSLPWIYLLEGWDSLTMAVLGNFGYI